MKPTQKVCAARRLREPTTGCKRVA